jgi:hypothetical protein
VDAWISEEERREMGASWRVAPEWVRNTRVFSSKDVPRSVMAVPPRVVPRVG